MSASVQAATPITFERFIQRAKPFVAWFLAALAGAVIGSAVSYQFQSQLNNRAALQQQYMGALQLFNQTGTAMDVSITNLADAVVEKRPIADAKEKARIAIGDHLSAAQALAEIVGRKNMETYMSGVGTLRELVDGASDAKSMMQASQARFDIMHNRTIIRAEAQENIYSL